MSGFGSGGFGGGGFGHQPQQQQQQAAPAPSFGSAFGQPQLQQQSQPPATPGFGTATGGGAAFGTPASAAAAAPLASSGFGGGGGFGTGGFGVGSTSNASTPSAGGAFSSFGTPPPTAGGFGTSGGGGTGGFGQTAPIAAAGAVPPPGAPAFGQTMSTPAPATAAAFGVANTYSAFGAAPAQTTPSFGGGFGSSSGGGFGSSGGGGGGFGDPAATTPTSAQQHTGFGAPAPASSSAAVPNPFGGGTAAPAPAISFGTSTTVAQAPSGAQPSFGGGDFSSGGGGFGSATATTSGDGFGSTATSGGFGSTTGNITSGFNAPAAPAFGTSSATTGGFGQQVAGGGGMSSSTSAFGGGSAFGSGGFGSTNTSSSPAPFGDGGGGAFGTSAAAVAASGDDGMMGADSSDAGGSSTPFGTIPRKKRPEGSGTSVFGGADDAGAGGGSDELSRLKAKLEAKKKKLEEQKRQRAEKQREEEEKASDAATALFGGASASSPTPFAAASSKSSRRGMTPSPVPIKKGDVRGFGGGGGGGSGSAGGQIDKAAMAAKNAARFATKTDRSTRSLLPADLLKKAQAREEGSDQEEPEEGEVNDDEDNMSGKGALHKAKSLDGICMVMCPDEELLRREKEGDIQMLETPDPGGIHPADWTLRDTAVKRFRRSAADFKLDIPELVRPPAILERCCAYLEEWVMERDRQGPDSRYGDSVPPSLDVYQFIWDRTRMIRKDYILQNYTGTGGRCSAAAVRCHERIARWHCMMEHQLSHISDYVVQQSQQNIQELGQAMKTLNQYYDDSEGRSTIEDKKSDPRHGCQNDSIMGGRAPVDYDGTVLGNDSSTMDTSSRIIGQSGSASNGTAEPEMRGLYIVLTLNNDGGMEVLKYASSLYKNRPEIYNSRPVQLALSVFRAWKENNYARFFSILRDPGTPYLFACVMFKHVMDMRKSAIKTMSRSYGGKSREGMNHYDKYPLSRLRDLLCFESTEEARDACQHYNITVVAGDDGGRYGGEWIEWRKSSFKEKTDPKKGHIIPLRPLKMNKTIESKRMNATRLAVCRGEVSGEGSTLSHVVRPPGTMSLQERMAAQQEQQQRLAAEAEERAKDAARLQQQKEAAEKIEAERRRKATEAAAKAEELARKEREEQQRRQEQEERERQRKLALQRAEEERKEKLRLEMEEKKRKEEEARKREEQRIQRLKEAAARAEAERREAEEAARLAAIERKREEERLRLEAKERERQRQLELKRIEEERRAAEARRRAEEEAARAAEAARRAEEERLRRIREEEERKEREWQRKLDAARKEMVFRRWRRRAEENNRGVRQTHQTLERLREVQLSPAVLLSISSRTEGKSASTAVVSRRTFSAPEPTRPEDFFYQLGNMLGKQIDLSTLVADALSGEISQQQQQDQQHAANASDQHPQSNHYVSLFKMAVVVPSFDGPSADLTEKLYKWMYSRFEFGTTNLAHRFVDEKTIEVRSCAVQIRDKASSVKGCDSAILVIPPFDASQCNDCISFLSSQAEALSQNSVRFVCLNLDDGIDAGYSQMIHNLIEGGHLGASHIGNLAPVSWNIDGLDSSLFASCEVLRSDFAQSQVVDGEPFGIGRISLPKLGRMCLRNILWDSEYLVIEDSVRATETGILRLLDGTISCLVLELNDTVARLRRTMLSSWPCRDFASSTEHPLAVAKYWCDEFALPLNWLNGPHASEPSSPLDAANIENVLLESFEVYRTADTVRDAAQVLLASAPLNVKELCKELTWDTKYRLALEEILTWQDASLSSDEEIIYLPRCEISGLVERTMRRVSDLNARNVEENVPALTSETAIAVSFPTSRRVVDADWKAAVWEPSTASTALSSSHRSKRRAQKDADAGASGSSSSALHRAKRRRPAAKKGKSSKKKKSQEVQRSEQFSARLEALLYGEATVEMNIAGVPLSDILAQSNTGIELPK